MRSRSSQLSLLPMGWASQSVRKPQQLVARYEWFVPELSCLVEDLNNKTIDFGCDGARTVTF
jgi:hypothetical protein